MAPLSARRVLGALFLATALVSILAPPVLAQTAKIETAATANGQTLVLTHYATAGGAPVLMIHGFGANGNEWDLPGESFARALFAAGYDVWIGDWRRSGRAPVR